MNPLLDSEFLIKLNNDRNRTIYAHVISLNQYEHPVEQLEGVVTAGSINIDGQSAVRRTCSLTLSAKNLNINNVYWGLSTKVKIEIGLQNNIIGYEDYGDIIWFKQGIFILTDFKTTQTLNNYTINLSGKDKMCLLNGDVSGNLPATTIFDSYADRSGQSYTITKQDARKGYYNNFFDDAAYEATLEGFQEQYGSDYSYIRGIKKIIALQYKPKQTITELSDVKDITIQFNALDEPKSFKDILSSTTNKQGYYDINIDEKTILGFIVNNCREGDSFVWEIEQKIPIPIIIQELLHQYGQERYSNIILKNIEPYAVEMLDNDSDETLYLLHDGDAYSAMINKDDLIKNYRIDLRDEEPNKTDKIKIDDDGEIINIIFESYVGEDNLSLIDVLSGSTISQYIKKPTKIIKYKDFSKTYTIRKILPGDAAGYGMTLLVYPDELRGNVGDSITSILDKIVNMLGNYEYFYNLDGQFIFQAKPAYLKTAWNNTIYLKNDNYVEPKELGKQVAYTFDDAILTTQYQNSPNINNIKNDYIIWGERKRDNETIKFHGRYAIANIPLEYTDFNGYTWTSNKKETILQILEKKLAKASASFQRQYHYPKGLDANWWEINDWANFYMNTFEVNLSHASFKMQEYSQEKGLIKSNEATISNFQTNFGYKNNLVSGSVFTDVVVIIYNDREKKHISKVVGHGKCIHYYPQFMDLRELGEGWQYSDEIDPNTGQVDIINTINPELKYTLDNGMILSKGYHPDYTNAFIHKPILPTDKDSITADLIFSLIYPNTQNINGVTRKYALNEDVDWRHLISVMAEDWYQNHTKDDYEINLRQNNCWTQLDIDLFPYGRTGYEQFYLDLSSTGGFWQTLYNANYIKYLYLKTHNDLMQQLYDENGEYDKKNQYYSILSMFDPEVCQIEKYGEVNKKTNLYIESSSIEDDEDSGYKKIIISVLDEDNQQILNNELLEISSYIVKKAWGRKKIDDQTQYQVSFTIKPDIITDGIIHIEDSFIVQLLQNGPVNKKTLTNNISQLYWTQTMRNNMAQYFESGQYKYWNRNVIENPELLIFWFDFFKADEMGIGKFAINVIGDRTKTINDTAIKTIIYRDTPDVIYCSWDEYFNYKQAMVLKDGYKYIILDKNNNGYVADDIEELFTYYELLQKARKDNKEEEIQKYLDLINSLGETEEKVNKFYNKFIQSSKQIQYIRSIRGKTVHEQAEDMLYQYSYYNDTVNINNVPIYYLQPNTIISIKDELSKIIGYYVINKLSISLAYNGTMQITAIKSPERIY